MTIQYFPIVVFITIALLVSAGMIILSYIISPQRLYGEKVTSYECGFNAFDDARMKFDVRFYLVGILFIIFDLEISYLFPWATRLSSITSLGFWMMILFLLILTVGFYYEWKKGALEWE